MIDILAIVNTSHTSNWIVWFQLIATWRIWCAALKNDGFEITAGIGARVFIV